MKVKQKRIGFAVVAVLLIVAGWSIWCLVQVPDLSKESSGNVETKVQTEAGQQIGTESQTENSGEITESVNPEDAVTSLSVNGVDGSCVILYAEENRYVLATASHVAPKKTGTVFFAGQEVTVTDYRKAPDYDLAFLIVEQIDAAENVNAEVFAGLCPAQIDTKAYEESKEQDEILVCGVVAGEKVSQKGTLQSNWIYIEDFGYHMLWAEAENVKGGMSGGGVFDGKGRLLGLLLGSDGKGQIVALPLSIIAGEWENTDFAGTIDIFSN